MDKDIAQIPLTRGLYALCDVNDYEYLMQWKWFAMEHRTKTGKILWYAGRQSRVADGYTTRRLVRMHQQLLGVSPNPLLTEIDHRNRNGLDNRRCNIWHCTKQDNSRNRGQLNKKQKTPKGVYRHNSRWAAQLSVDKVLHYLGTFDTPEKAAAVVEAFQAAAWTKKLGSIEATIGSKEAPISHTDNNSVVNDVKP